MNFHFKALITFLAFHIVVTIGGLLADQINLMSSTYSDEQQVPMDVVVIIWTTLCLGVSLAGLALAYLLRKVVRVFRD